MIGVGDGVSYEMIRIGANVGGGEHMFIMDEVDIEKQIIYLLETITEPIISDINFEYNEAVIEKLDLPSFLKKGSLADIFLQFKEGVKPEQI